MAWHTTWSAASKGVAHDMYAPNMGRSHQQLRPYLTGCYICLAVSQTCLLIRKGTK